MTIAPLDLLIFVAIGACAGWLASAVLKFRGLNLLGNIVVGVIGSFIGAYLFRQLGISTAGLIGMMITATGGAMLLLFAIKLIRK